MGRTRTGTELNRDATDPKKVHMEAHSDHVTTSLTADNAPTVAPLFLCSFPGEDVTNPVVTVNSPGAGRADSFPHSLVFLTPLSCFHVLKAERGFTIVGRLLLSTINALHLSHNSSQIPSYRIKEPYFYFEIIL